MKQFEVGKTYQMSSICNADCIWEYVVVNRTAKTITIQSTHNSIVKKCRVHTAESNACDAETVFPLGNYSMCPKLRADSQKIVSEDPEQRYACYWLMSLMMIPCRVNSSIAKE